jgi:hypothetical protein
MIDSYLVKDIGDNDQKPALNTDLGYARSIVAQENIHARAKSSKIQKRKGKIKHHKLVKILTDSAKKREATKDRGAHQSNP